MKKTIIVAVIVLMLALAAYFLFRKPKEEKIEVPNTDPGTGGGATKPLDEPKNPMPLKVGSGYIAGSYANTLVKDIQDALNTKYKAGLLADGKFGPKTLAALLANKFGGMIYWKQYSEITGKALTTTQAAAEDTGGVFTASNAANWWSYLTTW